MSAKLKFANYRLRHNALIRTLRRMCADVTDCNCIGMCPVCGCFESYSFVDGVFLCGNYCEFTFLNTLEYELPRIALRLEQTLPNNLTCDESHALIRGDIPIAADVYARKWWPVIAALYA